MKKLILKSLVITTIINAVGVLTNYLTAKLGDFLLIYVSLSGGEYRGYVGFGILLEHIYPMTDGTRATHISFSILNFITYYLLIFIIVLLILFIVKRYKEKNKKREVN